mmetsp:Transcript_16542/g.25689  ORF Transcript_16542/g.25689 Transcript_16542/m.25689 type:complete len:125 (+) Transcript_16542:167-541(+)
MRGLGLVCVSIQAVAAFVSPSAPHSLILTQRQPFSSQATHLQAQSAGALGMRAVALRSRNPEAAELGADGLRVDELGAERRRILRALAYFGFGGLGLRGLGVEGLAPASAATRRSLLRVLNPPS